VNRTIAIAAPAITRSSSGKNVKLVVGESALIGNSERSVSNSYRPCVTTASAHLPEIQERTL
jgi:hypothetical protein